MDITPIENEFKKKISEKIEIFLKAKGDLKYLPLLCLLMVII